MENLFGCEYLAAREGSKVILLEFKLLSLFDHSATLFILGRGHLSGFLEGGSALNLSRIFFFFFMSDLVALHDKFAAY